MEKTSPSAACLGTLLKPKSLKPDGSEPPPVVLLIGGSGPTDRNGNQGGTGPAELRQLAEQLAEQGIASLRYDKRGVGRSPAPGLREEDLVLNAYVEDAVAWLDWLQQRPDLGKRIVAGHSEGGLIAMLAAKRTAVAGIVLLATPGRKLADVVRDQLQRIGMEPPLQAEALTILASLERGEKVSSVNPALQALFRPSVQPYMISELAIDPAKELNSLALPVMIVSGGHDLQVGSADAALLVRRTSRCNPPRCARHESRAENGAGGSRRPAGRVFESGYSARGRCERCDRELRPPIGALAKGQNGAGGNVRRFVVFAVLFPLLAFIVAFWGMLQILNWTLGEKSTADYHQLVLLPLAYVLVLLPAMLTAVVDDVLARRNIRYRILWAALAGYVFIFAPLLAALLTGSMHRPTSSCSKSSVRCPEQFAHGRQDAKHPCRMTRSLNVRRH